MTTSRPFAVDCSRLGEVPHVYNALRRKLLAAVSEGHEGTHCAGACLPPTSWTIQPVPSGSVNEKKVL